MSNEFGSAGVPVSPIGRWFPVHHERAAARVRLFCVPHAGAGASAYLPWARALPHRIDVRGVELPGRGTRAAEPPLRRVASVVERLCSAICPLLDLPYVLHGHSMGALVAFETARALQAADLPAPAALVVSGMVAPARWPVRPPAHRMDPAALVAQAEELFGLPPEIAADEDVLALLLPVLRADLEVAETYRYRPGRPLSCPVTVLAGAHDRAVRPTDVEGWREVTTGEFELRIFDGGHFFLHERPDVVDDIAARYERFAAQAPHTLE